MWTVRYNSEQWLPLGTVYLLYIQDLYRHFPDIFCYPCNLHWICTYHSYISHLYTKIPRIVTITSRYVSIPNRGNSVGMSLTIGHSLISTQFWHWSFLQTKPCSQSELSRHASLRHSPLTQVSNSAQSLFLKHPFWLHLPFEHTEFG